MSSKPRRAYVQMFIAYPARLDDGTEILVQVPLIFSLN